MRLSIARLVTSIACLMLLVSAAQGILSVYSFSQVHDSIDVVAQSRVPSFIIIGKMNADVGNVRIAESAIISASPQQRQRFTSDLQSALSSVGENMTKYQALLVDPADKEFFASFESKWNEAQNQWAQVYTLLEGGDIDKAKELFFGKAQESFDAAGKTLQEAVDDMAGDTKNESDTAQAHVGMGSTSAIIAVGISIICGIFCIILGSIFIGRPLARITIAMRKLTEGDVDAPIVGAERKDEIGDMAQALEIFREAARSNQRLESEAEVNRKKAELDRLDAQERAQTEASERLRIATSGLAVGLKKLADGDLSIRLTEAFDTDFEGLRHDFNQSVNHLGSTLSAVSSSVSTMEDGTREIASGANDLSRRTEQQAASLEETAAAVEQITTNVKNSSKRTEEARALALSANQSAIKSAAVVSQAEEAMEKIEQSSNQISSIIGVIDEIAFQTNLLALNAGVEAARAGEAGKGFAVVAQEVRELAQRSAQAAKEIKALIKNSSVEVGSGVSLVRDTSQALKTIGSFIEQINSHMDSIATATREQATGLAEVNQAVNSMDQTTQQNAAMVEQSTAASNALAMEAGKLRDLVGQFKLDSTPALQSAALRGSARAMSRSA